MEGELERLLESGVEWQATSESKYVFRTVFEGRHFELRLNDFPDEPLCTIMVDDHQIDVDSFPETWTLPKHRTRIRVRGTILPGRGCLTGKPRPTKGKKGGKKT